MSKVHKIFLMDSQYAPSLRYFSMTSIIWVQSEEPTISFHTLSWPFHKSDVSMVRCPSHMVPLKVNWATSLQGTLGMRWMSDPSSLSLSSCLSMLRISQRLCFMYSGFLWSLEETSFPHYPSYLLTAQCFTYMKRVSMASLTRQQVINCPRDLDLIDLLGEGRNILCFRPSKHIRIASRNDYETPRRPVFTSSVLWSTV